MKLRVLFSLKKETKGILSKYRDNFIIYEAEDNVALQELLEEGDNLLLIAATDETIRLGQSLGIATLGYSGGDFLAGVEYVVESFDEVDASYLEKVYQRYHHIPWIIAETERCVIRELTLDDMDALFELYSDKELTQYTEELLDHEEETMYQYAYINNMYRYYGYGMWLVFLKENGALIGRAGLEHREVDETVIELGYLIKKSYQHQGLAQEVCQAILDFAKEEFKITKINCFIEEGNTPSIKLAEKLGFFYTETHVEQNRKMLRFIRK